MEHNINTLTRSLSTDYGRLQCRESLVFHGERSNEQQNKMVCQQFEKKDYITVNLYVYRVVQGRIASTTTKTTTPTQYLIISSTFIIIGSNMFIIYLIKSHLPVRCLSVYRLITCIILASFPLTPTYISLRLRHREHKKLCMDSKRAPKSKRACI